MIKKANYPPVTKVYKVCSYNELICSPAWNNLTGKSAIIYSHFLRKRKFADAGKKGREHKVCTNPRYLIFTYKEAEEDWGITEHQFYMGIRQLVSYGFIDIVRKGGTLWKYKTIYGLSERWKDIK